MSRVERQVASESVQGRTYKVVVELDCQCPGFTNHRRCKHVAAVVEEMLTRQPKPPMASPPREPPQPDPEDPVAALLVTVAAENARTARDIDAILRKQAEWWQRHGFPRP